MTRSGLRRKVFLAAVGTAALAAWAAGFVADLYMVTSMSMMPSLVPGDVVLCLAPSREIQRGDVVIIDEGRESTVGIKRVVALPGDVASYVGKSLSVNGAVVPKTLGEKLSIRDAGDLQFSETLGSKTYQIQENHGQPLYAIQPTELSAYFVLGDNRDQSRDSRAFGVVSRDRIRCRASMILATEWGGSFTLARVRWL